MIKYREELLLVPVYALEKAIKHMTIVPGIRYKENIGEIDGNFQLGNYDNSKLGDGALEINGRELETFFGNVVEPIDPNAIVKSIWGDNFTKGDALKKVNLTKLAATVMARRVGDNLYKNLFTAKHDASDTKQTSKFFNGFNTIIDNDIAGKNYVGKTLISEENGNITYGSEAITISNAEKIIKDFYWSADEQLRDQELKLFMNDKYLYYYNECYQANHGSLIYNNGYVKTTLDGASNVEFVGLSCIPEGEMILTPKSNILVLFNLRTEDEKFIIEKSLKSHYLVDFIMNYFFGTQFRSVRKEYFKCWRKQTQ